MCAHARACNVHGSLNPVEQTHGTYTKHRFIEEIPEELKEGAKAAAAARLDECAASSSIKPAAASAMLPSAATPASDTRAPPGGVGGVAREHGRLSLGSKGAKLGRGEAGGGISGGVVEDGPGGAIGGGGRGGGNMYNNAGSPCLKSASGILAKSMHPSSNAATTARGWGGEGGGGGWRGGAGGGWGGGGAPSTPMLQPSSTPKVAESSASSWGAQAAGKSFQPWLSGRNCRGPLAPAPATPAAANSAVNTPSVNIEATAASSSNIKTSTPLTSGGVYVWSMCSQI